MIEKYLEKINFNLSSKKGSFLYEIHENFLIDKNKFNELILNIKGLKKKNFYLVDINKEFIYNIIDKVGYMYGILNDIKVNNYSFTDKNNTDFHEYLTELEYEILSLFNEHIIEDYHGNKY